MSKKILSIVAALVFVAGVASAAIVITLNGYRNVSVVLEPVSGPCEVGTDCILLVTVNGVVMDSDGGDRSTYTFQFRTDDPVYLAAPYNVNATAAKNMYIKSRRAWKFQALAEDSD